MIVENAERLLAPYIKLSDTKLLSFDSRLEQVMLRLELDTPERSTQSAILVGIYGMGGVGKSTLATRVYDHDKSIGKRRIYLHVGKDCKSPQDLNSKRCTLLQKLSGSSTAPSFDVAEQSRNALRNALGSGGALLLVLDDLWEKEQLRWLLACGDSEDLHSAVAALPGGSRVLLTSRDKTVVAVFKPGMSARLIQLDVLPDYSARKMLLQEAWPSPDGLPPLEEKLKPDQEALALRHCGGLPLALRLLGRQLREAEDIEVHLPF